MCCGGAAKNQDVMVEMEAPLRENGQSLSAMCCGRAAKNPEAYCYVLRQAAFRPTAPPGKAWFNFYSLLNCQGFRIHAGPTLHKITI